MFDKYSCIPQIDCGVTQGSILVPFFFLPYVNDMNQALDCDFFLYTDDSSLFYQHKDVKEIQRNLNKHFLDVYDSFVDNKLIDLINIGLIKSVVLTLDMVKYTLSNITR